ncbi:UDP-2,3-diacylglucosamine diphosphatase [Methylococcus capsulatus]|uniref:UDP-2,3-diacylglucosamine diphosphatase n=1 Tax=Methylococcus capsulatus TaxID=414 RepID=UPI001C52B703|nr:UDP-2,3-diacylglucosamine diphosphatase [Methylococcus capsulatus]QXP87969.1 UDP-2,3-diacylglucosamine diphosphatase [Methylococcus capsulatus]QXP95019.1 UDP-2,3-diacylglucosamine diphosphatase [Methylococcus capsulatus]UQN12992.1 UDP-2,3-diacylglucosamine diphosphatase [Methylococcus capsulatus]
MASLEQTLRLETLFIADLHLSATGPGRVRLFQDFLAGHARGAEALYILGDLFDAYIGDDDTAFPAGVVRRSLRELTQSGTRVFFQQGNRDFLVGPEFAAATGATLLDDYTVIDLYGHKAVVTHGDLLCTDDRKYQQARARVRTDAWKRHALGKPLWVRRLYARWYRLRSVLDKRGTAPEIMDVNAAEVARVFRDFGADVMIHGHTHRPADHNLVCGRPVRRIVLAEWHSEGEFLRWTPEGGRRVRISP